MNMMLVPFLAAHSKEFFDAMELGDKMMLGLIVTGIGILMVFVILGLIILSIYLMNFVLDTIIPKIQIKVKKGKKEAPAEIKAETKAPEVVYEEVDDKKVVACISAAVMQMLDDECDGRRPNISFRISSIKKVVK